MFKLLFTSATTACFEWDNDLIYTRSPYTVLLDGVEVLSADTNVFSLFNLKPATTYTVTALPDNATLTFATNPESCCINVRDFGAVGDGIADDTRALQAAINCVRPRGRVLIPAGTYSTAPLTLKSNFTLELAEGATLLGSTDVERYFPLPGAVNDAATGDEIHVATWEGNPVSARQPFIGGWHVENVNIVGRGTIDGNAQNSTWWQNPKQEPGRPRLVFLNDCDNINLHGITGQNSASWQMHPYFSRNICFYDISVNAPKDSPNTDGLDPESCDVVNIIGCKFSVGDDCIALKSGKIYMGKKYKQPAARHTIRNCLMQFGHGAVVLGSEMAGGVVDLTVNRCKFFRTDRGLRIKTRRGRGEDAKIDGVLFENIEMDEVLTPIVINMYYNCCDPDRFSEYVWSREHLPVDDRTPYLGKFTFRNMNCRNCEVTAAYCDGLPEQPIRSVTVENVNFHFKSDAKAGVPAMRSYIDPFKKGGLYFDNVAELNLKGVTFDGVEGEELIAQHVGIINKE
jgi:polygalacturonase